jgi:TPP-dependent indolepyruvate ferredoxin oxidoreductase alpha subunit
VDCLAAERGKRVGGDATASTTCLPATTPASASPAPDADLEGRLIAQAVPVATVIDGCVGCGLCGENAHAATLCPSFYPAEIVQNPRWHERLLASLRRATLRALQPA